MFLILAYDIFLKGFLSISRRSYWAFQEKKSYSEDIKSFSSWSLLNLYPILQWHPFPEFPFFYLSLPSWNIIFGILPHSKFHWYQSFLKNSLQAHFTVGFQSLEISVIEGQLWLYIVYFFLFRIIIAHSHRWIA